MWINTRHRVLANVLCFAFVIAASEVWFDGLAWWQRWVFVYIPAGFVFNGFFRYMGWWQESDQDDPATPTVAPIYHDWVAPTGSTTPSRD